MTFDRFSRLRLFAVGAIGAAMLAGTAIAGDVTHDRLVNSENEPGNWINHHGNYEAHRFSALSDINKDNVGDLRVAFTYAMGSAQGGGTDPVVFPFAGLEGTTIAEDGFLYLTTGWGVGYQDRRARRQGRHGVEVGP